MEIIVSEQSDYQHIMVCRNGGSTELVLDGHPQSELPNNEYYEVLLGQSSNDVLVLGGGDLTGVDVFCANKVKRWKIVEIDEQVVKICAKFTKRKRKLWKSNVIIDDALTYLQHCEPVEHIIVDLLAMTKFDALSAPYSFFKFVSLLSDKTTKWASGFINAGSQGTAAGIVMIPLLLQAGFEHVQILINEYGENFFWATKPGHESAVRPDHRKYVIEYGAALVDEAIFDFDIDEQLIVIDEGL